MRYPKNNYAQRGSVLILALLILVVMTILGVSSMSGTSLEQKMAGNFRDRQIAFNAAETALADAESFINSSVNSAAVFDGSNGLYDFSNGPTPDEAFADSWWTSSNSRSIATSINEVKTQPRYIIEHRGSIGEEEGTSVNIGGYGESTGGGEITGFRITVRATGLTDNSVVFLQSYYGKRL